MNDHERSYSQISNYLPEVWFFKEGDNANRLLSVLLRMHQLQGNPPPRGRGLLCVLLLRFC